MIVHTQATDDRRNCFSTSLPFFDNHITVKCDLASSEKYKNLFLWEGDMNEEFGVKNVTEIWSLHDMSNSKDVIAGPEDTRLEKVFFNAPITVMQILKSTKKKKKRGKVGSLKIDKRDKLL